MTSVTTSRIRASSTSTERNRRVSASMYWFASRLAIESPAPKIGFSIVARLPMSMVTAIVSPSARPSARKPPATMPGRA